MSRDLDFSDGFEASTAPTISAISANSVQTFANDAAYVTNKGSAAAAGDIYHNTTDGFIHEYDGAAWIVVTTVTGSQVLTNKTLTTPTIGSFVNANHTHASAAQGGSVAHTDLTSIGTNTHAAIDTHIGTANIHFTEASISHTAITNIGTNSHATIDSHISASTAHGTSSAIVGISDAQVLTLKDIDGGTASNTSRITIPKNTTANLNALTRKAGTIAYDTTTNTVKFDDGSILADIDSGGAAQLSASNELLNLGLAASVSANALTIDLKQANGSSDPSTGTSSVKIGFRSSTVTSGGYSEVSVTAALSVVVSSGSTLGHLNGVDSYVYVYAINNAGTAELAVSSYLFDEGSVVSTTAEGGAGAADSYTVIYSTTARSNVATRLIGRVKSNQATAGTWAATPSEVSVMPFSKIKKNFVRVINGNSWASTDVSIRRFTTTQDSIGSAITYADSATLGATFTINEDGYYSAYWTEQPSVAAEMGISLNTTQGNTAVGNISNSDRYAYIQAAASRYQEVSATFYCKAGDVVRAHGEGANLNNGDDRTMFHISKIDLFR